MQAPTVSRTPQQRRAAAESFSATWEGRGYEKGDTATFWNQLLTEVVCLEDVVTNVRYEERAYSGGYIDVVIAEARTIVEQKALGVSLDKPELRQGQMVTPFQQALSYANSLPNSQRPDFIIVSNFETFRIHNLDVAKPDENYVEFALAELAAQLHLLDFLTDPQRARAKREEKASMEAGQLIGKLYSKLRDQYQFPDSTASQHSLNVLCVRLVFCLFAEDAGLFGKDALYNYLHGMPANVVRGRLKELFEVLDTPVEQRTDPYMDPQLKAFPYVNGGLFRPGDNQEIPPFTDDILELLLEEVSRDTNWAEISPTIFGGVFESTLNPEIRAQGGMHYTTPNNIHKVIDPLFLDDLKDELAEIVDAEGLTPRKRNKLLEKFHDKIASLTFFDPACGSGNFLTETYIQLRRLENKVLSILYGGQTQLGFEMTNPLKVSLNQFYGIEINDFAVSVASTALWIAQLQANVEAQSIITQEIEDLPLHDAANILHGNALKVDWKTVIAPTVCNYIIGNPPFLGARNQSKEQKAELKDVFPAGTRNVGDIDYVAGWFIKAAEFMGDHDVRTAFVATNSVVQGVQVANIWYPIMNMGFQINFAHDTFRWVTDANDGAHVFCVIVGFSKQNDLVRLFHYDHPDARPELQHPNRLNAYLADGPDVFIWNRSKPISNVPEMAIGNKPIDGGQYIFTTEEKEAFVAQEPKAVNFFKEFIGSRELINGTKRWILWLGEATSDDFKKMPLARERVKAVQEYRLASKSVPTQKLANKPTRFHVENMPDGESIVIPEVTTSRRKYLPIGLIPPGVLASNLVKLIPNASRFHFGVLNSQFHHAWMRVVAGRLGNGYRYSSGVVYNNFVFPQPTDAQRLEIERCAQAVLDARAEYEGATLADLYDPDNNFLYPTLVRAHQELDKSVEAAYGVEFSHLDDAEREQEIVAHLFRLYAEAIELENK
ncbi:class I SAM-dependent DNA methyltransferase [Corynebacterium endometrii]|uniref:site-specific DNA-methyltransferase (adenine-specific) n=1 Tax=Corynebacterium endometrii TaxID=2488819 RepID=A0A4P7QGK6_9CORY|nr:DNA methyltransferase [Corynebacterium endometrii]QCB27914.1 hypothetical protein CENDO_03085 [Corynebacterium endometrii]